MVAPADGSGGHGPAGAFDDEAGGELTRDERWLRLWAYGTSPYGLGLKAEDLWRLTAREFLALKAVHQEYVRRWAISASMFANAHRNPDELPFIPEDFMGLRNRQLAKVEKQRGDEEIWRMNLKWSKMKKGAPPPEDVHPFAREAWERQQREKGNG